MIPTSLEDWSYDVIKEMVSKGYLETDTFDFKSTFKSLDPKYHDSLVTTACAFANTTKGGFFVFGVFRKNDGSYEITGIERSDNLAMEFGQQISNANPTIYFIPKNPPIEIPGTNKVLPVFYVPQSVNRPHMNEQGKFYYRTNTGNEQMSYEQIRDAFLGYEQRRHSIRLLYTELIYNRDIAGLLRESAIANKTDIPNYYFETDVIVNLLPSVYPLIAEDKELINAIMKIRNDLTQANAMTKFTLSQVSMPVSNAPGIVEVHNHSMVLHIDTTVSRNIAEAMHILETRYNINKP